MILQYSFDIQKKKTFYQYNIYYIFIVRKIIDKKNQYIKKKQSYYITIAIYENFRDAI